MEKLPQSSDHELPMVRMFREDVEELVESIFSAFPDAVQRRVEVDEFRLDKPSDIETIASSRKRIGNLSAFIMVRSTAESPSTKSSADDLATLRLRLSKYSADVDVSDDGNLALLGLARKLEGVVVRRHRWEQPLRSKWVSAGLGTALACAVIKSGTLAGLLAIPLLLAVSLACYFLAFHRPYSLVDLTYYRDRSSFLARNKDAIIMNVLSAVAGVLITLGVQAGFERLAKPAQNVAAPSLPSTSSAATPVVSSAVLPAAIPSSTPSAGTNKPNATAP